MAQRDNPRRSNSAEAVGTLLWLLDSQSVDRRRYGILNRLRAVRDSEEFEALPDALRQRVRDILADTED
jgi:hypothetical protein